MSKRTQDVDRKCFLISVISQLPFPDQVCVCMYVYLCVYVCLFVFKGEGT